MKAEPRINQQRLLRRIAEFAELGATPAGGVNRQALSQEDRAARHLLADLAFARGFKVYQDSVANLFIRRDGQNADLQPLLIGSHLDSQPTGGRFDGALGTLTAFEVLEALEDAGAVTDRAIEVVAWTNEEGSRFSPGCMGSMAFVGAARVADWSETVGADGAKFGDELAATLAALPKVKTNVVGHPISAFVELHIEQGPILEHDGIAIGVVNGVQGTKWLEVSFVGQAAHAGTTPLEFRKDPLAAAALVISSLQQNVMSADPLARLTVGRLIVEPGSINVIPGKVSFTIDFRHPFEDALDALERKIVEGCKSAAQSHRCIVEIEERFHMPSGKFDASVIVEIGEACRELGIRTLSMVSGAFHDALFVSRAAPTAMIFVPCKDGLSHNEAEFVSVEHIRLGGMALLETARRLSGCGVL